jgi:hypothetical protein
VRLRNLLLTAAALVPAVRSFAVEYGLTYISVPGRIDFVQTDLARGTVQPMSDNASFGTFGFLAVVPIPGSVGPFTPGVETGFLIPAGSQAFDHRELAKNGATHDSRHDGDFTTWDVTGVPLLLAIRFSQPSENVSFGGEVGAGVMFLGVSVDRTLTTYDSSDSTVVLRETLRHQDVAISPVVQALAGLVVPASEGMDLRLYGGLVWIADVPETVTSDATAPALVHGGASDLPGLTVGGLGFVLRLALNVTL